MSKFVTEAMRAGATGVGAGLGYMGPHTIHVGGGANKVWGGAAWIKEAWAEGNKARKSNPVVPGATNTAAAAETAEQIAKHNAKMTGLKE
jgi:hypothetical protein